MKKHKYQTNITWTGNQGVGTKQYNAYTRDYTVAIENKADVLGSSDPAFLMLWFLHLASTNGIVVIEYTDTASGVMVEKEDGSGYFESVILNPVVTITDSSRIEETNDLHRLANKYCFIANSLNFQVQHKPICKVGSLFTNH